MDRSEAMNRLRVLLTYADASTFDKYVPAPVSPKDKLALQTAIKDMEYLAQNLCSRCGSPTPTSQLQEVATPHGPKAICGGCCEIVANSRR